MKYSRRVVSTSGPQRFAISFRDRGYSTRHGANSYEHPSTSEQQKSQLLERLCSDKKRNFDQALPVDAQKFYSLTHYRGLKNVPIDFVENVTIKDSRHNNDLLIEAYKVLGYRTVVKEVPTHVGSDFSTVKILSLDCPGASSPSFNIPKYIRLKEYNLNAYSLDVQKLVKKIFEQQRDHSKDKDLNIRNQQTIRLLQHLTTNPLSHVQFNQLLNNFALLLNNKDTLRVSKKDLIALKEKAPELVKPIIKGYNWNAIGVNISSLANGDRYLWETHEEFISSLRQNNIGIYEKWDDFRELKSFHTTECSEEHIVERYFHDDSHSELPQNSSTIVFTDGLIRYIKECHERLEIQHRNNGFVYKKADMREATVNKLLNETADLPAELIFNHYPRTVTLKENINFTATKWVINEHPSDQEHCPGWLADPNPHGKGDRSIDPRSLEVKTSEAVESVNAHGSERALCPIKSSHFQDIVAAASKIGRTR